MSSERVFFSHTVAAMFLEAFVPRDFPGLEAALRKEGIDVTRPLLPAYPYAAWRAALEAQRAIVLPHASLEEASREQGARYVAAYFDRTLIGSPLKTLLKIIGPRRALERMSRNFKTANNFSEVSLVQTSAGRGTLWVNDTFSRSPHYVVGMIEHGLELCGTKVQLTPLAQAGDACQFDCRW